MLKASDYTIIRTDLFPSLQDLQALFDSLTDENRENSLKAYIETSYIAHKNVAKNRNNSNEDIK
jgi:hypothetical protein